MIQIDILWTDLTMDARRSVCEALHDDPKNAEDDSYNNWDVVPMAILEIDEGAYGIDENV